MSGAEHALHGCHAGPAIRRMAWAFLACAVVFAGWAPLGATERASAIGYSITRIASKPAGTGANGASRLPALSGDGTTAFFQSQATNLGAGIQDIVACDLRSGQTKVLSVGLGGAVANGTSGSASANTDGRYVAFVSDASNLVAADGNSSHDVFVCDRSTGAIAAVSVTAAGTTGNGDSFAAAISGNGRYVAFVSSASNLVAGDTNGCDDVFVRDRATGVTTLASVARGGGFPNGSSSAPSISLDGARVAFSSAASDLIAGDTNGQPDVFVAQRDGSSLTRVSVSSSGTQATLGSFAPSIDGTGRRIAFDSLAANLVASDTNGARDVFVRDTAAGTTTLVSASSAGVQGDEESRDACLSTTSRKC